MGAEPAPVGQVVETCLYVEDVEHVAAWYERVLGLERVAQELPRHVFLRAGDSMLLFFDPRESAKESDVPSHGAEGVQHVALGVETTDGWPQRLGEHGVEVVDEARFGQGHSLYFLDPAGNVVELVSRGTWPPW